MKKFWIVNKTNNDTATILIYGYIHAYDVSAADFIVELSQLASIYKNIDIRINSGGGSVFEGIAIYNTIKTFQRAGKNIETYVDGIAASMGGVIAISGNKVHMSKYGRLMTHRAQGIGIGDPEEIRAAADLVESAEGDIAKIFASKTGLSDEEVKAKFMKPGVDLWLKAEECIKEKLADEIYDAEPVKVPENITDEKQVYNIFETCLNKTSIIPNQNSYKMKKELLSKIGLPENATDDQIDNAVEKVLADKTAAETALAGKDKEVAETIIDQAIADKKLLAADKEPYMKAFANNVDGLKLSIAKLAPAQKPGDIINQGAGGSAAATDEVKTFSDLMKKGAKAVDAFKTENRTEYNKLFKAEYGFEPTEEV